MLTVETTPNWLGCAGRAGERADQAAVLGQELRVLLALLARRLGVVAQARHAVEQERRPEHHRRLAGEVGAARGVDVLGALDGVVGRDVAVPAQRLDARRRVERDLAAVADELAALGERDVLERLGGEAVAGLRGERDPGHAVAVELLGGRAHVVERLRRLQAGLLEQVLAVDQQLAPAVARDAGRLAVAGHEVERLLGEGLRSELVDDRLRGLGVEDLLRRVLLRLVQRRAEHDVGQIAARRGVGHQRRELILGDPDQLGLDLGLLRELVEDRLRRLHAVRLGLVVPDGQGLAARRAPAAAARLLVVAAATAAHGHGGEDGACRSVLRVACSPLSS